MDYKRMLCWIRPNEKKDLEVAVAGRFPLVFAKNYEDFRSQITEGDYLVVSSLTAHNNKDFKHLVKNNKIHILLDDEYLYDDVMDAFLNLEKPYDHYVINHLVEDYQKGCSPAAFQKSSVSDKENAPAIFIINAVYS